MSGTPQPEAEQQDAPPPAYVWVLPPRRRRSGWAWWVVAVTLVVGAGVAATLLLHLPRQGAAGPVPGGSAATAAPLSGPAAEFRDRVQPPLDAAAEALAGVPRSSSDRAVAAVDGLLADVRELTALDAPSSVDRRWDDELAGYAERLGVLRTVLRTGSVATAELADAVRSVATLRTMAGL